MVIFLEVDFYKRVLDVPWTFEKLDYKENHIVSAVSEILRYTLKKDILLLLYDNIPFMEG